MTLRTALSKTSYLLPKVRVVRPATTFIMNRGYAEGSIGGTRSGGEAAGDSFSKREKAQEDMYFRQREAERLKKLREKLAAQRQHLDELDKHIDEMERESGGERK